ncbi:hypothetical protein GNX18_02735 [Microbulbifer sp. SH-1]|uniref:hypothetical protein n=1 Tax=Microbulbifer sp. SH-1 TaxID=2681547 RepID=UPI00140E03BC|nr:hypothetical protein [Microbulbifer sp. SH-1]QIL88801.1 hypothetical protein GNX18_02735 [Microbulbifer sp. SH-1]
MKLKNVISISFLLALSPFSFSYEWSASEYVDNCSVVYKSEFTIEDRALLNYCVGVTKGTLSGIIFTKSIESGRPFIPNCFDASNDKFLNLQKDLVATMRLSNKGLSVAAEPNTANAAVANALLKLLPCLIE